MRVYFLPRRALRIAAVIAVVVLFMAILAYFWESSLNAYKLEEPIYQGQTGQKVIALTFNVDWGEEYVPDLLKILEQNGVKATFFLTGRWAEEFPELVKNMKKHGHCLGNHGYKHLHLNNLSPEQVKEEITRAEKVIQTITGERPYLFAPPYGEFNTSVQKVAAELGYKIVMWSLDTVDWQRPEASTIVNRVVPRIHNDAIILMHPTQPTVEALPSILKQLKEEGYRFATVSEIVGNTATEKGTEP
ncbi:MAG TPA: polysaccharide deacetylase family protein [Syntrophothermus lipocalidus]|nr:polysaccharide deacetylase family protein [Syntrophothermus lipocalidus]